MNSFRLTLFIIFGLFLTACGEDKNLTPSAVESATNTATIEIDIGKDKRTSVNKTLVIDAESVPNNEDVSSYLWEYQGNTLATTRSFTYTPTQLGINTLDFSVLYNDGSKASDKINIIVTSIDIDVSIPTISEALKSEYLLAINQARTKAQDCHSRGTFPSTTNLTWNDKLYKASYEHSQDLIASKTFAHKGSGTESDWTGYTLGKSSDLVERSEAYGYDWSNLGENLAGGTTMDTAEKAVESWLLSDNHCENLMNPNFTEVGMAMLKDENSLYTHYWSQNFGTAK